MKTNAVKEVNETALELFEVLEFQYPFRSYQKLVLSMFDEIRQKQNKFHIVAPPGSGKTILGVEIIRQFAAPAVIFSPTTTIQEQWREKFLLFLPNGKQRLIDRLVSSEPQELKPVNTLTYQVLSTPSENRDFLRELGVQCWREDLIKRGKLDEAAAGERIELLKANNPDAYKKEVSKYQLVAKQNLLGDPDFDLRRLLHSNAKSLIDKLARNGTKVIVLDECHHLLDYWAVVLKELIRSLPNVFVVGLTATPPLSAAPGELDNYLYLVGQIDFEVPTPAVVKSGNLAPYQDLVYLVAPTPKESEFLKLQKDIFLNLVQQIASDPAFRTYFFNRLVSRQDKKGQQVPWKEFLNDQLDLAIAGVKYLRSIQTELPGEIRILDEMRQPLSVDDWLMLLEDYCLNHLKVSQESKDGLLLKDIRAALKTLGVVLSETGFRQYISATERVLALSDAKNSAVVDILRHESESMADRLRAVVITDYEKSSAMSLKSLAGVLDPEAGGAVRVLRHLVSDTVTDKLDPIMLTGETVLIDADWANRFIEEAQRWFKAQRLTAVVFVRGSEDHHIAQIVGEGKDWRPKNYVRLTTMLFEQGITKCIIGTRGLLGEGWDSLSLNTLIDLTSAGTFATVNQIRGRSLRLDPNDASKVANNWDVVCVAPGIPKGQNDFERFVRKHSQFYGLGKRGRIVKGIQHVDEQLALAYFAKVLAKLEFMVLNSRGLSKAKNRARAYEDWERFVGKPYSNFHLRATEIRAEDMKFRTAYTFKHSLRRLFYILMANVGGHFTILMHVIPRQAYEDVRLFWIFYLLAGLIAGGISARYVKLYFRKAFLEVPVDSYLKDFGKAILQALKDAELVGPQLSFENLRVEVADGGIYRVFLDYASEKDAATFSECFKEIMSPVTDQRYLVSRNEASLDRNFFSPLWYVIWETMRVFRRQDTFYHPVPGMFGANKRLAVSFGRAWATYVGGGRLIYTRSNKGRDILLRNRIKNRLQIGVTLAEEWR